jgi:hypothetical protein
VWEDAWRSGAVALDDSPVTPRRLSRDLARIRREMGLSAPDRLIARGLFAWAALFGCLSFEVFGQYGPDTLTDPADLFEQHLAALVEAVGLTPTGR